MFSSMTLRLCTVVIAVAGAGLAQDLSTACSLRTQSAGSLFASAPKRPVEGTPLPAAVPTTPDYLYAAATGPIAPSYEQCVASCEARADLCRESGITAGACASKYMACVRGCASTYAQ